MVNPSAIAVTVADAAPGTLPKKKERKNGRKKKWKKKKKEMSVKFKKKTKKFPYIFSPFSYLYFYPQYHLYHLHLN